ncbi:MAG: hypothetical protein IJG50_02565 [Clostridia bacterium]|nr:hypothetical protein [Clostridia bacterium]
MKYEGCVQGRAARISLEREGMDFGSRFLDYADIENISPINHRIFINTQTGEHINISMLGFSYDGFYEELCSLFGKRSLEALFVNEKIIMSSEGEYETPRERGRAKIALFSDSICILPPTANAVRIPLCFAEEIQLEGYMIFVTLASGTRYVVGRMGYDTKPFFERAVNLAKGVKNMRARALETVALKPPFMYKGLFRTAEPKHYWQAAVGKGVCALELFTDEDAATYLYRFDESETEFLSKLCEATEAMGEYREIIHISEEQLLKKPLFCMAVRRCEAVSFLRARSAGRLIHSRSHAERLKEFLC